MAIVVIAVTKSMASPSKFVEIINSNEHKYKILNQIENWLMPNYYTRIKII